jgi:hypothetical protein
MSEKVYFLMSAELANQILNYFLSCPFGQVRNLVVGMEAMKQVRTEPTKTTEETVEA